MFQTCSTLQFTHTHILYNIYYIKYVLQHILNSTKVDCVDTLYKVGLMNALIIMLFA